MMSQISAQYCDGLEVRIKELQAENAALKAEIVEWQKSLCEQGEVIEGLKAEIAALMEELEQAWGERNEAVASKVNDEAIVHVQPVAQARSRAGRRAAAEMERSKGK